MSAPLYFIDCVPTFPLYSGCLNDVKPRQNVYNMYEPHVCTM